MALMKLMTKELERKIPPLYFNEGMPIPNQVAHVRYFDPCGSWTWYGTEYNPKERLLFGCVKGFEIELGYFSLDELESIKGPLGIGIERDLHFESMPLGDIEEIAELIDRFRPEDSDKPEGPKDNFTFEVYQINNVRDANNLKFCGFSDFFPDFNPNEAIPELDLTPYDCVYSGTISPLRGSSTSVVLEVIFSKFNVGTHPFDYYGHSISVSDVVKLPDEFGNDSYHLCDICGWQTVRAAGAPRYMTEEEIDIRRQIRSYMVDRAHQEHGTEGYSVAQEAIGGLCAKLRDMGVRE